MTRLGRLVADQQRSLSCPHCGHDARDHGGEVAFLTFPCKIEGCGCLWNRAKYLAHPVVACPKCGAQPGSPCTRISDFHQGQRPILSRPHAERIAADGGVYLICSHCQTEGRNATTWFTSRTAAAAHERTAHPDNGQTVFVVEREDFHYDDRTRRWVYDADRLERR